MALFNRIVAAFLWLFLLITITILAVAPVGAIQQLQRFLDIALTQIQAWQVTSGDNFIIAQATIGISAVLLFGILFWLNCGGCASVACAFVLPTGGKPNWTRPVSVVVWNGT